MDSYSAREYYEPNAARHNLSVLTDALVEEILLDKEHGGRVSSTGVRFSKDGKQFIIKAKKEVILCCGVINSPQLLELSGIGSPSHALKKDHGRVFIDNPNVGKNLNDHTATGIPFVSRPP